MVLPPYLSEDAYDSNLALHLAHFGDVEAARKIVDPKDAATQAEIGRLQLRRNFPAEWTRLVALILHQAHYKLAEVDNISARRVVALHRQLLELLNDNEVRQSRLATALLSRGQTLLQAAETAWLAAEKQEEWVDLARNGALANWGTYAVPVLPAPRSPKEFAAWLGGKHHGLLVASGDTLRALDMLELPLPIGAGASAVTAAEGVVGLFDAAGKLREILVIYGHIDDAYHTNKLTSLLDEQIASSSPPNVAFQLEQFPRKAENFVAPLTIIRLMPRAAVEPTRTAAVACLPRDFGLVHLDRTYESNRRIFNIQQNGPMLAVKDSGVLSSLKWPYGGQKFAEASLTRDVKADLVADLHLVLQKDPSKRNRLIDIAGPIWQVAGPSKFQATGSSSKDTFNLIWSDGTTELTLSYPHNDEAVSFTLRDDSGRSIEQRLEVAQKRDEAERRERWTEGRAVQRVKRSIESFPFQLGLFRADLDKRLTGRQALRNDTKAGDLLTFPGPPHDEAEWALRQALVRFDESGRLEEFRLRITDVAGRKGHAEKRLLSILRNDNGAPELVALADIPGADAKNPVKLMRCATTSPASRPASMHRASSW